MTTYNTGNPLGSTDPRDLYDNAENVDNFVNGQDIAYVDRLGKSRKSWAGMEADFQNFLINSGYQFIGDYDADGPLLISTANQIFTKDGEYWRAKPSLTLPYTTINNWAIDQDFFVSIGDAALRLDLASLSPSLGAAIIGRNVQIVDSIASLKGLDKTAVSKHAFVTGYYAKGDGGGGAYYYDGLDVSSADNGGSIIVATDGGRWKLVNTDRITPQQFGAKGDKVTDDTVAIQAAYNAVKLGGTFYIPKASGDAYIISKQGTNTYCLDFSRMINIEADGIFSSLQPAAGTTVNTILLKPNPAIPYYGMKWDGLALGDPYTGLRAGLTGIFIDTDVAGSNLPKAVFRRLIIGEASVVGGTAITHVNNIANNVNGAMYGCSIEDCPMLKGGIILNGSGDSNTIHKNIISGPNIGVFASLVTGASLLTIVDNNITTLGGSIKISGGSRYKILRNNCEQIAATPGVTYMFDIEGSAATMSTGEIRGNHLGAFTATGITANIRLSNNVGAHIAENVMLPASVFGLGIQIDSNNFGTRVGPNTYGSGIVSGNRVADSGNGTMGARKLPTLLNGWVNFGSGVEEASFFKDTDGIVHLSGSIKSGTAVAGTVLFTLPSGFRPAGACIAPTSQNSGSAEAFGAVSILSSGDVTIQTGANIQFSLNGVSFRALDGANTVSDL